MRKTFLAITLFLAFSKAALAQFGNCTASEILSKLTISKLSISTSGRMARRSRSGFMKQR